MDTTPEYVAMCGCKEVQDLLDADESYFAWRRQTMVCQEHGGYPLHLDGVHVKFCPLCGTKTIREEELCFGQNPKGPDNYTKLPCLDQLIGMVGGKPGAFGLICPEKEKWAARLANVTFNANTHEQAMLKLVMWVRHGKKWGDGQWK